MNNVDDDDDDDDDDNDDNNNDNNNVSFSSYWKTSNGKQFTAAREMLTVDIRHQTKACS